MLLVSKTNDCKEMLVNEISIFINFATNECAH